MQTADLRDRITLLEPFEEKNADGQLIQTYVERGTVWANIKHRPGSEAFQHSRMEAKSPATIALRVSTLTRKISSEWRIATTDRAYEVKGDPFLSEDRAFVVFQVEGTRK